ATGREAKPFPKVSGGDLIGLAVSPDGSLVAAAGVEARIHVFDFTNRTLRCPFDGHSGKVVSLAFSPDGSRLISTGGDGRIRPRFQAPGFGTSPPANKNSISPSKNYTRSRSRSLPMVSCSRLAIWKKKASSDFGTRRFGRPRVRASNLSLTSPMALKRDPF